ncbi:MAG: PEP-utilizing enzyme, partial [Planctomycetota bacterium]|nr:PEP-utilizing enzyme [Planctomycetota bacterium]
MSPKLRSESRFHGLPISGGIRRARVCLFRLGTNDDIPDYEVSGEGVAQEKQRLTRAKALVTQHLETLKKVVVDRIGQAEAEIFTAQAMLLADPAVETAMAKIIEDGHNAERAVFRAFDDFRTRLQESQNPLLRERAADLNELKRRLLDVLCDINPALRCASNPECQRNHERVIITEELTPSVALELDTSEVVGIVTERGGITSHAAILARGLGIPAVSGIPHIHELVECGTEVIVDGDSGEVILCPTPETAARMTPTIPIASHLVPEPVEGLRVMANIGLAGNVRDALAAKAEGIGLYRTEFEITAAGRLLSEEEHLERYSAVTKAMDGLPVYFRLLDIGGDKPSPLFDFPYEVNPSLGLRGARFLLARPDLLRPQARALARLSARRPVHVMYPMIVDLEQYLRLRDLFDEVTADLPKGAISHGVMFEVPSACLQAREIFEDADFASVGTNDLVQYLFAVDRNNEAVAEDYTPDRPIFWRLLEDLA